MARVGPVRTARPGRTVGRIQNRGAGRGLLPWCPAPHPQAPARSADSGPFGAQPASQQAADLGNHGARVGVLPVAQPAPAVGETKINP